MNRRGTWGPPTILFVLLCAAYGWSQATIDESKESNHLYVDASTGNDANPGTATAPFKTLNKGLTEASKNARNGIGTKVTVQPGVYRESLNIGQNRGGTVAPMTVEAATPGTVVVSGADQWTGWSGSSGVYTHAWSYNWGLCPTTSGVYEAPITLRREMIFVNNAPLTQVLELDELAPGTFLVDEVHGTVYVQPAPGTDMATADVEVSTRNSLLNNANAQNLVLRGMTFAMANNCRDSAAAVMFNGGSQVLIDNDQFNWNNAAGLQLSTVTGYTVQNSIANHNGESGFGAMQSKNGLWASNQANYNTWRGAQGAIYGWNSGGFHFFQEHNNTMTGDTAMLNQAHGLHWDTDTANVSASGMMLARNLRDGMLVEKSQGPINISNSNICSNNKLLLQFDGGAAVRASTYVTINNSNLWNNHLQQVPIVGIGSAPITVVNYETGQVYQLQTSNLTLNSDTFSGLTSEVLVNDGFQKGSVWDNFRATLGSDYNTWWNGAQSKAFTVPVPYQGTQVTFDGWRSSTGRDSHSSFAQPASMPTCQATNEAQDFWFVNSDQGTVTGTAGGTATINMAVIALGGFNGTTTFSAFGASAIPGSSSSWSQSSAAGSSIVQFNLNLNRSTTPGSYPVTLTANSGAVTRTVAVMVNVQ